MIGCGKSLTCKPCHTLLFYNKLRLCPMKRILFLIISLVSLFHTSASAQRIRPVFGFPATEPGYSLGVSACYAGQIGDWIVVAGGCNFPTPGNKTYYAGIYAAPVDGDVLNWRLVGMLPEPAAYGVTVVSGDSLLFIGGNNSTHALKSVYSIHLDGVGGRADVKRLADLPCTVDNMAVAQSKDNVFVVGGNHDGKPSADVLALNLNAANLSWSNIGSMPGSARVQPVAAALDGKLYVWGGFYANGEQSEVHTTGCCMNIATGKWTSVAAPKSVEGREMTLAGGIAWTFNGKIYATGGVNKDIFLDAISGRYERVKQADYLNQPISWYRFSGNLYEYDVLSEAWVKTRFADKGLARAGAQMVVTQKGCFYIGGELKPALRTPQIVVLQDLE